MTVRRTGRSSAKTRKTQHAEISKPLSRVREVMQVYGDWREADRGLGVYRSATTTPQRITTTNSSKVADDPVPTA